MTGDDMMTAGESAKHLGVHRTTFAGWVSKGWITPATNDGLRVVFSVDELDRFVRENPDVVQRTKRSNASRERQGKERIKGGAL